jgi:hypothetical protein
MFYTGLSFGVGSTAEFKCNNVDGAKGYYVRGTKEERQTITIRCMNE